MKHASTRAVFAHWDERRGDRPAPSRSDIDPVAIRHALGDTFMLAADFVDELRFRLAGTRVCALFCREIKGETFTALWSEDSRKQIDEILACINDESAGVVAGLTGRTADGSAVDLEFMLLPLARVGHARIRGLGVIAAAEIPYWVGEKPVTELELGTVRHVGPGIAAEMAPRLVPGQSISEIRHGFVVYKGGRTTPTNERTG